MSIIEEYHRLLDELLVDPTPEKARVFFKQWNPAEDFRDFPDSDITIMAGIHKTRLVRGIKVEESRQWLSDNGFKEDINNEMP